MAELANWLRLWRVPGVGPAVFQKILEDIGSPGDVFRASRRELESIGLSREVIDCLLSSTPEETERDLAWEQQPNNHIITFDDVRYPARLREIAHRPPLLYVMGNPAHLSDPQLAIVGCRHPTASGLENASLFAKQMARAGLAITSGLALGIDAAAHEAALDVGGITIAVAATGLDRVYPAKHRQLAHRIAACGTIASEFPIGAPPRAEFFPRRNRIISGLTLGTLVVEATRRSGSLITARYAAEQGREVFAIPGSIHNPAARGCHQLIRQGAKLVETVEDILEELAHVIDVQEISTSEAETASSLTLDEDYQRILDALGYDPTPIDTIVERSGLGADAVASMLLLLELNGVVASASNGTYTRCSQLND